jgi:hypothetical protein
MSAARKSRSEFARATRYRGHPKGSSRPSLLDEIAR